MKNKVFGLDVGATTLKAVWMDRKKDGYILNSVFTAVSPVKGMTSESPFDQEEMAQVIGKMMKDANIRSRNVNISLPENQVFTKVIEMPFLSDKEIASAIYWEAEQYIPVPLNTITLDYQVLKKPETPDSNQKMSILLVGAPTQLINKYETIFEMVGLTISSVETEILSVLRAIVTDANFPTTLIVNIGAISTSFAIVKQNTLVFTYTVSIGGTALSRAIAADFGLTAQQAEEYKKTYGISDANFGGKIGRATEPILQSILSETKKSLAYYNEKNVEDPIKQIIISGGTAKLPGFNAFLARNLATEIVIANPWKLLVSQDVPKEIIDEAPSYTVAVGLAMREYE